MPKISAPTLVEQRVWRRSQLLDVASAIALENGPTSITVSTVAARAGLSRTSFYEYFSSSSEIVAELITDELNEFTEFLAQKVAAASVPEEAIAAWIEGSLEYVADGRHLLARALSTLELSNERSTQIGIAHRKMLAPLSTPLNQLGVTDVRQALALIHAATESATRRIEAGLDSAREIESTREFLIAGLNALRK
jgi:AcrR family transcriptional regulator